MTYGGYSRLGKNKRVDGHRLMMSSDSYVLAHAFDVSQQIIMCNQIAFLIVYYMLTLYCSPFWTCACVCILYTTLKRKYI